MKVPLFKDLPIRPDAPPGSAWGVFDRDGKRDVFGTLNFITPEAAVAARSEIQTGESAVLNTLADPERRDYSNAVRYEDAAQKRIDQSLGIQSWSERGGIVARGVPIDYVRYAERKGITYDALGPHAISLDTIKEIIAEEKLEIRPGRIFIVRCGLSRYLRQSTPEDQTPFDDPCTHGGVHPTPEFLEWLWNHNIAAVAGDALSFETIPASDGSSKLIDQVYSAGELSYAE